VSSPPLPVEPQDLSLDQAIRIALANSQVVRLLTGLTAAASGRTIYDPAIANTAIDLARAAFDPMITVQNTFNRLEQPTAFFDPTVPAGVRIDGPRVDEYNLDVNVTKKNVLGGTLGFEVTDMVSRFTPGGEPLNPQAQSALTLSYTQPLLQGAGVGVNLAPIVIARINTELSFFQLKDSVEELVRGTVEAYWAIVFARTDVWARRQQVEQGKAALERAEARKRQGFGTESDVAQARLALSNFKSTLIAAEGNLLQREAALRNLLHLSPSRPDRIIPNTPPTDQRVEPNWDELLRLAEERRPDIVELKLILEADQQALLVAKNQALPRLDTTMLYRWNGLEGETPGGVNVSSRPGQFTDWTLGVNFSVPLGLRAGRAGLRRSELTLVRDQANLDQGIHNALHALATSYRSLAQDYEQYLALKETREAARANLDQQVASYRAGRTIFLNVVQAISDWGNAVSAEAQILAQYNTDLANLERQTGTILETHGVRFMEERYRSIGPLGRIGPKPAYPAAMQPGPNVPLYPALQKPSEEFFDLKTPMIQEQSPSPPDVLPPPRPQVSR
jgi:outer membrane protein TolC